MWRKCIEVGGSYQPRETQRFLNDDFVSKKRDIGLENTFVWS